MYRESNIALIDDEASVRDALENLLGALGYGVHAFGSAREFLESGELDSTDCVLVDVQMPEMSGVELLRRLVAGGHGVPVIVMTAYPQDATRARVLESGAIAYLAKPLREEALMKCLDQVIG